MTRTYLTYGERAVRMAEKAMQANGDAMPESFTPCDLRLLLNELNVPMFYVELNGDEESGPWLSKRAAEDYIDTHICERGVCDDAYDRVMQEYAVTDWQGEPVD